MWEREHAEQLVLGGVNGSRFVDVGDKGTMERWSSVHSNRLASGTSQFRRMAALTVMELRVT